MRLKKALSLILYYGLAKHFPNYSYPLGRWFNALRIAVIRNIIPVGQNCRIMKNVYFGNGNNVSIGHSCRINEKTRLDRVTIGNHVMIARETVFLGKMHEFEDLETPMVDQGERSQGQTVVEDNVWIGLRAIILPGLTLRNGTIIGAGAVVTKDTEVNGIYAGVPAKLVRFRQPPV